MWEKMESAEYGDSRFDWKQNDHFIFSGSLVGASYQVEIIESPLCPFSKFVLENHLLSCPPPSNYRWERHCHTLEKLMAQWKLNRVTQLPLRWPMGKARAPEVRQQGIPSCLCLRFYMCHGFSGPSCHCFDPNFKGTCGSNCHVHNILS